ncbi:MAG: hypothetical protein Q8N60_01265 [Candidatus Diapherotrites archaeon]|nr:hypothetical protein [Candidatus Diapherotrites archaeon]
MRKIWQKGTKGKKESISWMKKFRSGIMAEAKPGLAKVRHGFRVVFGPYITMIRIGEEIGGISPLNVKTSLGRKPVAHLNGTISGEVAKFYETAYSERLSGKDGLRALAVLMPSLEKGLRAAGIEMVGGRTHPAFARFLKQMGWKQIGKAGTTVDVKKNIAKINPRFLFRARPLRRPRKNAARRTGIGHVKA